MRNVNLYQTWRHRCLEAKPLLLMKQVKPSRIYTFSCIKAKSVTLLFLNSEFKWNPKYTYLNRIRKMHFKFLFLISGTVSPNLKFNLSFYVDLASSLNKLHLQKLSKDFFLYNRLKAVLIYLGAQVNVAYTRGHIFIYIFLSDEFPRSCITDQARQAVFHPTSISRQVDSNKTRRCKEF